MEHSQHAEKAFNLEEMRRQHRHHRYDLWLLVAGVIVCLVNLIGTLPFVHPKRRGTMTTTSLRALTSVEAGARCDQIDQVSGLEYCPQLEPLMPLLLENKRSLLRLALDAAKDAGEELPLMLANVLLEQASDLLFSGVHVKEGKAEGWIQKKRKLSGNSTGELPMASFQDRVDIFYAENLTRSRPVVVYVSGHDMCDFWNEFNGNQSDIPPSTDAPSLTNEGVVELAAMAVADGKTPLALVTLGWDGHGSPFVPSKSRECSNKVLALPQVVRWFLSHHYGSSPSPKVEFVPIGFGGVAPRSGLEQWQMVNASAEKLRAMDSCEAADRAEMLFQCNNNSPKTKRPQINAALQNGTTLAVPTGPRIIPINHFPMEPAATVAASTDAFFAISPPGTRPDCFRHYEFLLAGNIVYIPDEPSLRIVLAGLPVVFVKGLSMGWGRITCDAMVEHAEYIARRLELGQVKGKPAFDYSKLMLPHWIRFLGDSVRQAGVDIREWDGNALAVADNPDESDVYLEMTVGE